MGSEQLTTGLCRNMYKSTDQRFYRFTRCRLTQQSDREERSVGTGRTGCSDGHVGRGLPCYLLRYKVTGPSSRKLQAAVNNSTPVPTGLEAAISSIERMCQTAVPSAH